MYEIVLVPAGAPEDPESLGSKYKFWFGSQQFLFKQAREPSGEDWAEKVCAEVARLLGLPHAEYELGLWTRSALDVRGVVSSPKRSKRQPAGRAERRRARVA